MAYAIEAVRYGPNGQIEGVLWHSFIFENGLRRGSSISATIADVIAAADRGHAIHVCFAGAPGSTVAVITSADGSRTIADAVGADPHQLLSTLPRL